MIIFACGEQEKGPTGSNDEPLSLDDLFFGTDSTLDVVTWNIEDFPKNSETTNYVAQIIAAIDADIYGLQEIESDADFEEVINLLNFSDSLNSWNGYRSNSVSSNYGSINLAFIYKNTFYDSICEPFSTNWNAFPRPPLRLDITYQSENVTIINNHLKAGGDGELDLSDPWDEETRRYNACNSLDAYIFENLFAQNVIVIGDMNDELNDEEDNNVFMQFISTPEEYLFADWDIGWGSTDNWSYPGWPSHLDHILITNELFDEYNMSVSETRTFKIDDYLDNGWYEYDSNVSDHLPVGVKLKFLMHKD